ncbi:sodium:calcium antiporter [Salinisphaera orenii]|uniref:Cation transporter n=1 Tax=Salinisphaera orenii YIM 95161 TaxID=1051139 RepID=A0A423QBS3_9GAMM|nr:sodium:calcium antiporter [Salinisphaera halophila]ROO37742.1 cation transporter [Salinisphaera halophila YIM 95161]
MIGIESLGLTAVTAAFVVCALVIAVVGTRLTNVADELADRTGLGEAVTGAVLLGAATSLSGIVLSVTAAARDQPELAMSNALGGIAAQTVFLAMADVVYRRANLEHAAASIANLAQAALLLGLLSLLLIGAYSPDVHWLGVHPITPILFVAYVFGLQLVRNAEAAPMWTPRRTQETRTDSPDENNKAMSLVRLWGGFFVLAAILGLTGYVLESVASRLGSATGMSDTAVGVVLTAISTSLPELVTSIAAVRRGALQLAVGGIIGGNAFDCLFAATSDIAYRDGSIYHAVSGDTLLWVALSVAMTAVLLLGLIRRQKQGIGNIGFESATLFGLYGAGILMVVRG